MSLVKYQAKGWGSVRQLDVGFLLRVAIKLFLAELGNDLVFLACTVLGEHDKSARESHDRSNVVDVRDDHRGVGTIVAAGRGRLEDVVAVGVNLLGVLVAQTNNLGQFDVAVDRAARGCSAPGTRRGSGCSGWPPLRRGGTPRGA